MSFDAILRGDFRRGGFGVELPNYTVVSTEGDAWVVYSKPHAWRWESETTIHLADGREFGSLGDARAANGSVYVEVRRLLVPVDPVDDDPPVVPVVPVPPPVQPPVVPPPVTSTDGGGFLNNIFGGLAESTGLSVQTVAIGAAVIVVGGYFWLNSDSKPTRKR